MNIGSRQPVYLVRKGATKLSIEYGDGAKTIRRTCYSPEMECLNNPDIRLNGSAWIGDNKQLRIFVIGFRKALPIIKAGLRRIGYVVK